MISLREIADNDTHISSTRWAFAVIVILDVAVIVITVIAAIVGHFIKRPIDNSLFTSIAALLGVPTTLITAAKAIMGFETSHKENKAKESEEK